MYVEAEESVMLGAEVAGSGDLLHTGPLGEFYVCALNYSAASSLLTW